MVDDLSSADDAAEAHRPGGGPTATGPAATESGAAEHGAAEHGAAEHGAAEHGAAEHEAAEHGAAELGDGVEPPSARSARAMVVYRPRSAFPAAVAGAVRRSLAGLARQPLGELARQPMVMAPAAAVVTLATRRLATTALRAAATRQVARRTASGPSAGPAIVLVDVSVLVVHHWVGPGPAASDTDALTPRW